ncbi:hypothetical protein D9M71_691940 [compost metagenome]
MAHGREESTLGTAGFLSLVLGDLQLMTQALALGHIDPTAHQTNYRTCGTTVRRSPVIDLHALTMNLENTVGGMRLT